VAELCTGCGAELFQRQRFCRKCGRPIGEVIIAATQTIQHPQTAPAGGPETQSKLPAARQPQGSPWGWIIALCGITLVAALSVAILLYWSRTGRVQVRWPINQKRLELAAKDSNMEAFPLEPNAKVSITNLSGNITIEGWDLNRAELQVTKLGGSEADRQATRVIYSADKDSLWLKTDAAGKGVSVDYQIKLPRWLRKIEIDAINSNIRMIGLSGNISVEVKSGSVELVGVSGKVRARAINGKISASLDRWADQGVELSSVNGSIELHLPTGTNADLEASTLSGRIEAQGLSSVKSERRFVGQKAEGSIGSGGPNIKVRTINGDIKLAVEPPKASATKEMSYGYRSFAIS
jgi:hypothetical protein